MRFLSTAGHSLLTNWRNYHIISGSAGGVPEWLKGADCKSVGLAPTLVRIQPPPPGFLRRGLAVCTGWQKGSVVKRGCSSMVEQKPSKLTTRVRFPSPAPACCSRANRPQCGLRRCSSVVEHSLGKGEVARSIRANGTITVLRGNTQFDPR